MPPPSTTLAAGPLASARGWGGEGGQQAPSGSGKQSMAPLASSPAPLCPAVQQKPHTSSGDCASKLHPMALALLPSALAPPPTPLLSKPHSHSPWLAGSQHIRWHCCEAILTSTVGMAWVLPLSRLPALPSTSTGVRTPSIAHLHCGRPQGLHALAVHAMQGGDWSS